MKQMQHYGNRRGTSLVELMFGLVISAVLIAGIFKVANSVFTSANREKRKSEMLRSINTVSNIIERDIRMAGCGLPGNGMRAITNNGYNDYLMLFTNEMRVQTVLESSVGSSGYEIFVADAGEFDDDDWVCIEGPDTIYREIHSVTVYSSCPDKINIAGTIGVAHTFPAGTKVYKASRIAYTVVTSPKPALTRKKNDLLVGLGDGLEKIAVIPKKASGSVVPYARDADVLTVVLGGYLGEGHNRILYADSTEVNIRN